jgi:hypothetical protein
VTRDGIGRGLRRVRRVVGRCVGGFLPEPLSVRSTLATAIISAVALVGFGATLPGLVVGLVLAAAVWYMDTVEALTSTASALAMHARLSISYISWLCVGLAGLYANRTTHLVWLEWVCMGVLAITGWLISAQPGFLGVKPLAGTANLKHNPQHRRPPRVQIKELLQIIWAAVGITGVLATISIPATPWATLSVTVVTTATVVWAVGAAWLYADNARWRSVRELRKMKPRAVIPHDRVGTYQPEAWYPYLNEIGVPYYLIASTEKIMNRLAKSTSVPIVVPSRYTSDEVRALVPNTVRVAYYTHNSQENLPVLKDDRISHIFIHHGDGDKYASRNKRSASYDYLFVAGQGAIDRYADHGVHIPREKFRIIGRPQTSRITVDHTPIGEKSSPAILYAPTWYGASESANYSSLPMGHKIISSLLRRDLSIIFRPHPRSIGSKRHQKYIDQIEEMLRSDQEASGRPHLWGATTEGELSMIAQVNASDAMISDVSAMVTDYLQSGKPYTMVSVRWQAEEFRKKFPTSRSAYVIDDNPGSIDAALDAMLGDDPLADCRRQRRSYYLGGFEGRESVDRFVEESKKLMRNNNTQRALA